MRAPGVVENKGKDDHRKEHFKLSMIRHVGGLQVETVLLEMPEKAFDAPALSVDFESLFSPKAIRDNHKVAISIFWSHGFGRKEKAQAKNVLPMQEFAAGS